MPSLWRSHGVAAPPSGDVVAKFKVKQFESSLFYWENWRGYRNDFFNEAFQGRGRWLQIQFSSLKRNTELSCTLQSLTPDGDTETPGGGNRDVGTAPSRCWMILSSRGSLAGVLAQPHPLPSHRFGSELSHLPKISLGLKSNLFAAQVQALHHHGMAASGEVPQTTLCLCRTVSRLLSEWNFHSIYFQHFPE